MQPISRNYSYDECCSGLRRAEETTFSLMAAGFCQVGHDSGVVQITLKDTQELVGRGAAALCFAASPLSNDAKKKNEQLSAATTGLQHRTKIV